MIPVWGDMNLLPYSMLIVEVTDTASPRNIYKGAISTEHSSSELRVIGTTVYRFDKYFLHLKGILYLIPFYVVHLNLGPDSREPLVQMNCVHLIIPPNIR